MNHLWISKDHDQNEITNEKENEIILRINE